MLNRVFPVTIRPADADLVIDLYRAPADEVQSIGVFQAVLRPPQYVVAAGLLAATLIIYGNVDFREKVPATKPLGLIPLTLGDWQGSRYSMEPDLIHALNLSDYTLVEYRNPQGKEINIYIAYNESQRKGKSTHSPDSCLPGSGWIFRESGTLDMKAVGGADPSMRVKRAYMEKNGVKQIGYYWFPQRGRNLTNMFQLKAYSFWDALTRRRTDGALVRLITPVYEPEKPEDAEARLQEFARMFVPILNEFIPGREVK
jgi:EpsI family protein